MSEPPLNPHAVVTVKCAVCGIVKQEANHWFIVWADLPYFNCGPYSLRLMDARGPRSKPVCGQSCAQTEFESWMTAQRNAP